MAEPLARDEKTVEAAGPGTDEEIEESLMSITPVSQTTPVATLQQTQNSGLPKPKSNASQNPTDTVQLSPAALAHLKGGDADHDGDSH